MSNALWKNTKALILNLWFATPQELLIRYSKYSMFTLQFKRGHNFLL